MSQLFTTGKVISNLELKASAKQNLYIHFTLVEQIGYGEQMHSQFIHVQQAVPDGWRQHLH